MNARSNPMPARWATILALLICAGCAPSDDAAELPEPGRDLPVMELQTMDEPNDRDPGPGQSPADALGQATEAARRDLAAKLEVEPQAIEVIERRRVTWRNGAMGCPEPGMAYTQALVPGFWIRLKGGEEQFDYHGARGGSPFLCPADRAESPLPPDDNPVA